MDRKVYIPDGWHSDNKLSVDDMVCYAGHIGIIKRKHDRYNLIDVILYHKCGAVKEVTINSKHCTPYGFKNHSNIGIFKDSYGIHIGHIISLMGNRDVAKVVRCYNMDGTIYIKLILTKPVKIFKV